VAEVGLGCLDRAIMGADVTSLAKCSPDTTLRDTQELLGRGILVRNPAGARGTSYQLAEPETAREEPTRIE
jgi:hypothetical protein